MAEHERDGQRWKKRGVFPRHSSTHVRISLLTPVHNTPAGFLEEMFESVIGQTYEAWESCVVDAASNRAETVETLKRWAARDNRIRVERLPDNFGIAENTNHALRQATGTFVTCLDHDDVLAPFAAYELARAALR